MIITDFPELTVIYASKLYKEFLRHHGRTYLKKPPLTLHATFLATHKTGTTFAVCPKY